MEFLEKRARILRPLALVSLVLFLIVTAFCTQQILTDVQNDMMLISMAINFIATADALIVVSAVSLDRRGTLHNDFQILLFVLAALVLMFDTFTGYFEGRSETATLNCVSYHMMNLLFMFVAWLYVRYLCPTVDFPENVQKTIFRVTNVIFLVGFILLAVNIPTALFFDVNSEGYIFSGPYAIVMTLLPVSMPALALVCVLKYNDNKRYRFVASIMLVVAVLLLILEIVLPDLSPIYLTPIFVLLISFSNNYIYRSEIISDKETQLLKKNMELEDLKFHSMVSQVQPHFLYNALTSIMNIQGNPPQTKEAIADFATYLRVNLSTINTPHPIPFSKELDHIETYLSIEKLRFKDKLQVDWHINDKRFAVPALTVQTMVENAVKHGVTKKENGGKVIIVSEAVEDGHMVKIIDNGVGFDTESPAPNDGKMHVGIHSARERLKNMSNGTLTVKSTPGMGTTVMIFIPDVSMPPEDVPEDDEGLEF